MSILSTLKSPLHVFKDGGLIIVYDDANTHIGALIGLGEYVSPEKINQMTKIAKGLIYVCISEEKAEQLQIPKMIDDHDPDLSEETKHFAVSVDYKDTTTGISCNERAMTIKAMTMENVKPDDFKRPGHIFPLISKEKGLLQHVDFTEAIIDLSKMVSDIHVGYMSEILNSDGNTACLEEIKTMSQLHHIPLMKMSEILSLSNAQEICSIKGKVIEGRKIGRSIGFPTANIEPFEHAFHLERGVYGVKVLINNQEFCGVMNVGHRPTFKENEYSIHYEVHIFDFNQDIYDQQIQIKVCFYLREEISFQSISQLVYQIKNDVANAKFRFNFGSLKDYPVPQNSSTK